MFCFSASEPLSCLSLRSPLDRVKLVRLQASLRSLWVRDPDQERDLRHLHLAQGGDLRPGVPGGHGPGQGEALCRQVRGGLRGWVLGGLDQVREGGHHQAEESHLSPGSWRVSVSSPGTEETLSPSHPPAPAPAPGHQAPGDGVRGSLVQLHRWSSPQQTVSRREELGGGSLPVRPDLARHQAQLSSSRGRTEVERGPLQGRGRPEPRLEQLHGREPGHGGAGREAVLRGGEGLQGGPVVGLGDGAAGGVLPGGGDRGEKEEGDPQLQCRVWQTLSSPPGVQTNLSGVSVQVQVRAVILSLIC